jgi:ElaB/YqjD/DUF883 family membrane-anchored ribosome-binding protein
MATRNAKSLAAEEIAAIEDLMGDLEKRLRRLSGSAKREASGATGDVGDFVNEALTRIMGRVRHSAAETSDSVADDIASYGIGAIKKLTREIDQRPLIMLGIAAGIGFLAAMLNKKP